MSITTESGLGTKDDPDEEDTLLTTETIEFDPSMAPMVDSESLAKEQVDDYGVEWSQYDCRFCDEKFKFRKGRAYGTDWGHPDYRKNDDDALAKLKAHMSDFHHINESKAKENEYDKKCPECDMVFKADNGYFGGWANILVQTDKLKGHMKNAHGISIESKANESRTRQEINDHIKELKNMLKTGGSSKPYIQQELEHEKDELALAHEEGMGSVSGPPAGTEPTVREEEDTTFVLPADSNEKLSDKEDVAERELEQGELGEAKMTMKEWDDQYKQTQKNIDEFDNNPEVLAIAKKLEGGISIEDIVNETDSIMLNENYIQLGDVLYRPRYTSEEAWSDDLIFENKFFTSEGVGNCQFCKGAGKITVERLGLKECPDCEGTGDVQGNPMAQDPTQEPLLGEVPEVPNIQQEEVPDVTEPKKPNPFAKNGESKKKALERSHIDARDEYLRNGLSEITSMQEARDLLHDVESLEGYMNDLANGDAGLRALADEIRQRIKEAEEFTESKKKAKEGKYHYTVYVSPQGMERMYTGFVDASSEEDAKIKATSEITKKAGMKPESVSIISTESKKKSSEAKLKSGYVRCSKCDQQFSSVQWALDHEKEAHGESKRKAKEFDWDSQWESVYNDWSIEKLKDSIRNDVRALSSTGETDIQVSLDLKRKVLKEKTGESKKKSSESKRKANEGTEQERADKIAEDYLYDEDTGHNSERDIVARLVNRGFSEKVAKKSAKTWFGESRAKKKAKECKPCRKTLAHEASVSKFKKFIDSKIEILQKRAKAGESVSLMYGLPTVTRQGRKIKGILAYAGVSLNDRIYLPEELEKGHGLTLPLLLNHSSIAGAEDELDRLDDEMLSALYNEEDYEIGEVTLRWDASKLTLFYEGVVENEFFQKEIDDMDMAVSLGIYYDSDSPRICDVHCYTLIKGAEFREVSLVYHAGFPIATIEAVEAQLKERALKSIEKEEKLSNTIDRINKKNEPEGGWSEEDKVEETTTGADVANSIIGVDIAEEEQDDLARGGSVDVEEIEDEGPAPTIDLNDEWDGQTIVTEMFTHDNFSVRGVSGMTISNANGVERYTFDPTMNYSTNTIHFDTFGDGATIYGETLQIQPVMGTPEELTKEIESKPDIIIEDSDKDAFESVKKKKKVKKRL